MPAKSKFTIDPNIEINQDFQKALDLVTDQSKSVFITGKAGTGKSTLLNLIRAQSGKNLVVLAPTGLASLNVNGQTIHSFFRFPPQITLRDAEKLARERKTSKVLQNLELMIIDEVSMVRADLLDCIDIFLKIIKKSTLPFGGVQTVLIGDLYQLPPVLRYQEQLDFAKMYASPYFFASKVVQDLFGTDIFGNANQLGLVELKKVYRQSDTDFIDLLNAIRRGQKDEKILQKLNQRVIVTPQIPNSIILTTTNETSDGINQANLAKIQTKSQVYLGKITGKFNQRDLPTNADLELKINARVMFVKNDLKGKWVNGTLGYVTGLFGDHVLVTMDNGKEVEVMSETWEIYQATFNSTQNRLENESIGSFIQIPLKLAWAITIHKSQGQTFDKVILDLKHRAFSAGQTYVALSRCRTFEGLYLTRPVQSSDILTDLSVTKFLDQWQQKLTAGDEITLEITGE